MKNLLNFTGLFVALAVTAAPEGLVSKSATGTTSATVYFEPGQRTAALVTADVTSDKAASVLSWKTGAQQVTLLAAASAVTNLSVTTGLLPNSTNLLAVTADGTLTALTSHSTAAAQVTNYSLMFDNPIGTNLSAGDTLRELSTAFSVTASSSNLIALVTNSIVTNTALLLLERSPAQIETNSVASLATNGAVLTATLAHAFAYAPLKAYTLTTNVYTVKLPASSVSNAVVIDVTNGLAADDRLALLPSMGGAFVGQMNLASVYYYQTLTVSATNGVNFAIGDRIFVLGTAVTTPIGSATVRALGGPLRVLPANTPGVLSLDGTSACAINAAIVNY